MSKQHTPEFLEEMKQRLEADKKQLEDESGQTSNFPDYGRNDEDNATEIADFQTSSATKNVLQERLNGVLTALKRIEDGTYGVTEAGELIPEERLRANPAATTTV